MKYGYQVTAFREKTEQHKVQFFTNPKKVVEYARSLNDTGAKIDYQKIIPHLNDYKFFINDQSLGGTYFTVKKIEVN